jgi:spore coat polysaccharide biosynthesis protein SpsF
LYEHPETFRTVSARADADYSLHRWTLDTQEDLELIRNIYERFAAREHFSWREVLEVLDREPELVGINSRVAQQAV